MTDHIPPRGRADLKTGRRFPDTAPAQPLILLRPERFDVPAALVLGLLELLPFLVSGFLAGMASTDNPGSFYLGSGRNAFLLALACAGTVIVLRISNTVALLRHIAPDRVRPIAIGLLLFITGYSLFGFASGLVHARVGIPFDALLAGLVLWRGRVTAAGIQHRLSVITLAGAVVLTIAATGFAAMTPWASAIPLG